MPRATGGYERTTVGGEDVAAFVPHPLPPLDPPLDLDETAKGLLRQAEKGLAQLELAAEMVPSVHWFVYAFVRKEAVISSQIEGTQATLLDLLNFEATDRVDSTSPEQVEEVCNYLDALAYARDELRKESGLPVSMRLLNGAHERLMHGARGGNKQPGEIRRSQNWIGGTRPGNAAFVPPPPHLLGDLLGAFEEYIHTESDLPPLVRAGLLHVQFETIHPYLDGNGRIGRLLITLLFEHWGVLPQPLLYLSLFFKRHRSEYYRLLGIVRTEGDWESWIKFFFEGVATITAEAVLAARDLFSLVNTDRVRVLDAKGSTLQSVRLFDRLPEHPIITIAKAVELLETTKPTAAKAVNALVDVGILAETSGRRRDRTFAYSDYLEHLRVGTELGEE